MDTGGEMMRLCRLCLVKDQVNIPIFEEQGEIRQIFLKISSCLPVKVSRDDKLPKKICDGCSYKLDMLYEFWNTSANAEKTLLSWLGQAGVKANDADETISAVAQQINKGDAPFVKEEAVDPNDGAHQTQDVDPNFMLQNFQQKWNDEGASAGPSATVTSNEEPPRKRARRTAAVKAQINLTPESEDEDDIDNVEPMTKVEDESDESDGEDRDPNFVDVPGTSADDQPGPSGVGKDGVEAPFFSNLEVQLEVDEDEIKINESKLVQTIKSLKKRIKTKSDSDDQDYVPWFGLKKKKKKKKDKSEKDIDKTAKKKKKSKSKRKDKSIVKTEPKIWTCRKCLQEFPSRKCLVTHKKLDHVNDRVDEHTFRYDDEQDVYYCNTCSAEFQTKDEVQVHISKIHEENYVCEICSHISKKAYAYAVHLKTHSDDDFITCPLCSYTTPRRTCLQTHINRVHYHKFYYTCITCGKGFNDAVIYREHNNEHLGIKPFVCVVCNKAFAYSRYMLIHQVRYHTVHIEGVMHKTQCSICTKVFSKVETLLRHITTKHRTGITNERRHLCDHCGKGFGTSDKLKIHYRVHTGEKPFVCRYCEKSFTKKDYLIMHERVHTGEKPYPCEFCGKCFNQASSLRIHVRGHTGERPYVCNFCGGGYISRGSLNLHVKICNGLLV